MSSPKTTTLIYLCSKFDTFKIPVRFTSETKTKNKSRHFISTRMTNYEVIVLSEQDPLTTTTTTPCFPCFECNRCMARQEFFFKNGRKYCVQCFGHTFGLKCAVCDKAIEGVSKVNFILYENKVWHEGCFKCFNCRNIFNEEGLSKTGEHLTCTRCGAHVTCLKKR